MQVCEGAVHTRATRPAPRLTYSPPSYHNTGATPTLMDPFENNTVRGRHGDVVGVDMQICGVDKWILQQ